MTNKITFSCAPAEDNPEIVVTTYTFPNGFTASSRSVKNSNTICKILNKVAQLSEYEKGFLASLIKEIK